MRLFFLLLISFLLVSCMTPPEVSSKIEKENYSKIIANQTDAQEAKDEYKKLQEQRENE